MTNTEITRYCQSGDYAKAAELLHAEPDMKKVVTFLDNYGDKKLVALWRALAEPAITGGNGTITDEFGAAQAPGRAASQVRTR